ncbi:hypothetical protein TOT_020000803 [Theileria orientalis strain Shintoku]|uniref:Uncharacterized protein n=1 Tax=Theileria orientalis strain Shintoku TaxID=869250 RepID=J4C8C5_THEOR|nr:LOW QUALITY PROTEIN: hypothetical protein TOT_020000803 [Theileria orientalis strain Shintoku]BAM40548.1 hypothetical protein TOT_020000803 [Theileria orientalis strain Shintoku]|eukprot:XP_009690849.1 LOW QUALITY PROTEIN: hypothetical protein TOT_020000803 [Theileria orientalis strain Shintoku]
MPTVYSWRLKYYCECHSIHRVSLVPALWDLSAQQRLRALSILLSARALGPPRFPAVLESGPRRLTLFYPPLLSVRRPQCYFIGVSTLISVDRTLVPVSLADLGTLLRLVFLGICFNRCSFRYYDLLSYSLCGFCDFLVSFPPGHRQISVIKLAPTVRLRAVTTPSHWPLTGRYYPVVSSSCRLSPMASGAYVPRIDWCLRTAYRLVPTYRV